MKILLLLPVLIVANEITKDQIVKFLLENEQDALSPCDNLFRHVCPKGSSFIDIGMKNYKEIKKTVDHVEWLPLHLNVVKEWQRLAGEQFGFYTYPFLRDVCGSEMSQEAKKIRTDFVNFFLLPFLDISDAYNKANCSSIIKEASLLMPVTPVQVDGNAISWNKIHKFLVNVLLLNTEPLSEIMPFLNTIYNEMKKILLNWENETPWLSNHNVTEIYEKVLNETTLSQLDESKLQKFAQSLITFQSTFENCLTAIDYDDDAVSSMCVNYAYQQFSAPETENDELLTDYNAQNFDRVGYTHKFLLVGLPILLLADSDEFAVKMGAVSTVLGHELSHSATFLDFFPYISNATINCVTAQEAKSCEIFREEVCKTSADQYEESGSDLLGYKLAYQITKSYYGPRFYDLHPDLNITYQQLFFKSFALTLCGAPDYANDVHPATSIRYNAVAVQLEDFQDAFQCSSQSRMMSSKTEECYIFGKDALPDKRFF